MADNTKRSIRSFVLRQGRMTQGQHQALDKYWNNYGVDFSERLVDLDKLFSNNNEKLVLEIGFGNGKSLAEMAWNHPDINYVGIEVHKPGVGALLMEIERLQLTNLRCIHHDAIEVLEHMIADNCLDTVQLFFPDPWPKKKHHKRRIVNKGFLDLVTAKLKSNGCFLMATDWWPYAEDAMELLMEFRGLKNHADGKKFSQRPASRPKTKFEQRGEKLGHGVWDLVFVKT